MSFDWLNHIAESIEGQSDCPIMIMLAGPNGAGKSTFYERFLSVLEYDFFNADIAAQEVFNGHPENDDQSRQMQSSITQQVNDALSSQKSFIRETVFSDTKGYKIEELRKANALGYFVILIYIGIDSPDISAIRIQQRVKNGGHNVPAEKLPRRYTDSLVNLRNAIGIPDRTYIFDNSSAEKPLNCLLAFNGTKPLYQCDTMPEWASTISPV